MKKNKKGQLGLNDLPTTGFIVGLVIVMVVIMSMVIGGIQNTLCTYSYNASDGRCLNSTGGSGTTGADFSWEYNISEQGLEAQGTFGDNFDLIVTIIVMVVILGLVVGGFYAYMRR